MAKKENGNATKSFILRVDAEMMEAIEAWAADEFRSTNGQIQYILDQALRKAGRLKKKRILKSEEKSPYWLQGCNSKGREETVY